MNPILRPAFPALAALSLALLPVPSPAATAVPGGVPTTAATAPHPGAAFIHATVTLRDGGIHTGYLRWEDEDAFWDDIFSARQRELPWFEHADREALAREQQQREFEGRGLLGRLAWALHHQDNEVRLSRPFVCRYGDLAALRLSGDDDKPVVAVLRDGREVVVSGPSRDIDADLVVYPATGDPVELAWDDVREILFTAAPPGAAPYAERLAGTVEFRGGPLSGTIQWDTSECTGLDTLDSDQQDVALAQVRRIARGRRGGCDVTLADGSVVALSGTNDVGDGNRGAAVEAAGLGRVIVPWGRLIAADLRLCPATTPGYADFAAPRALEGTVTTADGRALSGRLVYDLDEAWSSDLLHGEHEGLSYQVPFGRLAGIAPTGPGAIEVTFRDGRKLALSGDEDTGDGHAGLLVFRDGQEKPEYVPWRLVRQVAFAP